MKTFCFLFAFVLSVSLYSCDKNTDDPGGPTVPDNTPLQLMKRISRYEENGLIHADSVAFTYDVAGHLTATVDPKTNLPTRRLIYNGDNLIALIDYINGKADTLNNPAKLMDGGNTIFLDFSRPNPGGGVDTIQITYKWSGELLLESWTYLHFVNSSALLQKSLFSYNASDNQLEHSIIFNDGSQQWQSRGMEYDQKKNYFHGIPRLNFIFGGWGFPHASRSVNNPVKAEIFPGEQAEYIWTYNDKGYPLTMQIKGKNYLAQEFQYNR